MLNGHSKMGKDKELKSEAPGNAFSRMNYLYQAAQLMTKISNCNPLSNYYNKIMKEISKKVLEKLHPDLKRTICCACNYPLTTGNNEINVKIKIHKKKRKKRILRFKQSKKELLKTKVNGSDFSVKYSKLQTEVKDKRPNKVRWTCSKCGYSKYFLQKPSKKLWIHEIEEKLYCV